MNFTEDIEFRLQSWSGKSYVWWMFKFKDFRIYNIARCYNNFNLATTQLSWYHTQFSCSHSKLKNIHNKTIRLYKLLWINHFLLINPTTICFWVGLISWLQSECLCQTNNCTSAKSRLLCFFFNLGAYVKSENEL